MLLQKSQFLPGTAGYTQLLIVRLQYTQAVLAVTYLEGFNPVVQHTAKIGTCGAFIQTQVSGGIHVSHAPSPRCCRLNPWQASLPAIRNRFVFKSTPAAGQCAGDHKLTVQGLL